MLELQHIPTPLHVVAVVVGCCCSIGGGGGGHPGGSLGFEDSKGLNLSFGLVNFCLKGVTVGVKFIFLFLEFLLQGHVIVRDPPVIVEDVIEPLATLR